MSFALALKHRIWMVAKRSKVLLLPSNFPYPDRLNPQPKADLRSDWTGLSRASHSLV